MLEVPRVELDWQVLHAWNAQLDALLPEVRVTRVRGLAHLYAWAWCGPGRCGSIGWRGASPLGVRVLSTERRLRRFLANPQVTVTTLWQPLLPALAGALGWRSEVVLVFDPTPFGATGRCLWVGIVVHRRVLPLTWRSGAAAGRPGRRR